MCNKTNYTRQVSIRDVDNATVCISGFQKNTVKIAFGHSVCSVGATGQISSCLCGSCESARSTPFKSFNRNIITIRVATFNCYGYFYPFRAVVCSCTTFNMVKA